MLHVFNEQDYGVYAVVDIVLDKIEDLKKEFDEGPGKKIHRRYDEKSKAFVRWLIKVKRYTSFTFREVEI